MIFDVKLDFTRKARFVARGDLTTTTPDVTYSSVVSRDSVRLSFLIAGLIQNHFSNFQPLKSVASSLYAQNTQKDPEFDCNIARTCLNFPTQACQLTTNHRRSTSFSY